MKSLALIFFLINTSVQHLLVRLFFVACHSLVSVIVFCFVAVELVMVVGGGGGGGGGGCCPSCVRKFRTSNFRSIILSL